MAGGSRTETNVAARPQVNVTYKVDLSGGQRRLKEAIYVKARRANEVFWSRQTQQDNLEGGLSIILRTAPAGDGSHLSKAQWGPALIDYGADNAGFISLSFSSIEEPEVHGGKTEYRPVAKVDPVLRLFSPEDIEYLDQSLRHYWEKTGTETSDASNTASLEISGEIGDAIPYEAAYFEDKSLPKATLQRLQSRRESLTCAPPNARNHRIRNPSKGAVRNLGGHRAIHEALEPIIEALYHNPQGFPFFQNQWVSFRYARTKAQNLYHLLWSSSRLNPMANATLFQHVEEDQDAT